ncbi:MAG TPA: isocitrate/isopropylmalate family dehydrogenase, partial [Bacteroidales bacterium]|nr:isocitrate/isopropylmalate family dehydrogenase [Bacteroidales bacterium]
MESEVKKISVQKVEIPFIEGDGIGKEITAATQKVIDAALERVYQGQKSIEWHELLAGEKAFNLTGSWLPDETMDLLSR